MKKNLKLFSTIASLCLAVALMAFGVWAALDESFSASGKISYTATGVDGYFYGYTVTASGDNPNKATLDNYSAANKLVQTPPNSSDVTSAIDNVTGISGISFSTGKDVAVFTVTAYFKNTGSTNAVRLTSSGTNETETGYTVVYGGESAGVSVGARGTGSVTVTVTVTVSSAEQKAQDAEFGWSVAFAAGPAQA